MGLEKGHCITGRPTRRIYSEDCFFDGSDVDMPVRKHLVLDVCNRCTSVGMAGGLHRYFRSTLYIA
ncbi:hypothetical protein EON64_03320 [archaeon]|nr:MAG: hypothetical protein EON64_03320 [archaeon]